MPHVSDKPDSDRSIGDGARLSYGRVKDAVFLMMLKRLTQLYRGKAGRDASVAK